MASPLRKQEPSDFDPSQLLATHEQHEKNIFELTGRVAKIEGNFRTPQDVASFFKECAKDSRNLEAVFAEMFCRFLSENEDVKLAFEKKLNDTDRNFFFKSFKRLWLPVYSAILILGTIVAKALVEWGLSLIPHK